MEKYTYNILNYEDQHAEAVAELWNESRDSWGGEQEIETAEERRQSEASNGNIATLLAFDANKVVGYCGFSEFRGDEGALYIPLLNVHPHYHGKGIGKQLVLEALQRTIELGWPRLDLYTWPGNTKAVPLYKRCGFFWEERDDSVHLLNFIPKVIAHPVLSQYVNASNWYECLKREISIKPDGEKSKGFTYYTYDFETTEGLISAKIEQSGRGISAFSTDQYEVEWELPSHHLLLTGEYEGKLRIINKQEQPLQIKATLEDHEFISGVLDITEQLTEEKTYTVPFTVERAPEIEQSKWKTHSKLVLNVEINGLRFPLEVGSNIQKPLSLHAFLLDPQQFVLGKTSDYYLQVENQLNETQLVKLAIADNQIYTLKLGAKEKQMLTVPFTAQHYGEQRQHVTIQSSLPWLDANYEEVIQFALPVRGQAFCMETPTELYLYQGQLALKCKKDLHQFSFIDAYNKTKRPLVLMHPMIGQPYSHKLAKQTWNSYTWENQQNVSTLKLNYILEKPACIVTRIIRWSSDGQITFAIEMTNREDSSLEDVQTAQIFYVEAEKAVMPVEGALLKLDEAIETAPINQLTDSWVYLESDGHTFGISWANDARLFTPSWQPALEQKTEIIEAGASHQFEPLKIEMDVYSDWQKFQTKLEPQPIRKQLALAFTREHGFNYPNQPVELTINQLSKQITKGDLILQGKKQADELLLEGESEQHIQLTSSPSTVTTITAEIELESHTESLRVQSIPVNGGSINKAISQEQGHKAFTVDNGVITFKAAPSYFPAVYSLQSQKKEWLDHAFPTPGPKSWWNPWGGGIHSMPIDVNLYSLLNQSSDATFVSVNDEWEQRWEGLSIDVTFTNHEKWKGLNLKQIFVTLPHSPLVASFYEIDYPNQLLLGDEFKTVAFLKRDEDQLLIYPNERTEQSKQTGSIPFEMLGEQVSSVVRIWDHQVKEGCVIVDADFYRYTELYSNTELSLWTASQSFKAAPEQGPVRSVPTFFCLTDQHLSGEGWDWLRKVRFKEVEHESY